MGGSVVGTDIEERGSSLAISRYKTLRPRSKPTPSEAAGGDENAKGIAESDAPLRERPGFELLQKFPSREAISAWSDYLERHALNSMLRGPNRQAPQ